MSHDSIPPAGPPVVLSGGEAAELRKVLVACSQMLTWARRHGGPDAVALVAEMTRSAAGGHSLGGLLYDINLAIGYLDFAPAATKAGPR